METGVNMDASRTVRRWMVRLACLGIVASTAACGGGGGDDDDSAKDEAASTTEATEATTTTTTAPPTTTTTEPPVVYEVVGSGTVVVDYTIAGDRSQQREVTLPWSEEQAEEPSRLSMLIAWGPDAAGD